MTHLSSLSMFNATMASTRHAAIRVLENVGAYLLLQLDDPINRSYVTDIAEAGGALVGLSNELYNITYPSETKHA